VDKKTSSDEMGSLDERPPVGPGADGRAGRDERRTTEADLKDGRARLLDLAEQPRTLAERRAAAGRTDEARRL